MTRLFSYCIPGDDGAAPNPFWGVCTLVICKPVIRRNAQVGDWIVGTGSTKFGFQNQVVYAMEVTQKMTMEEYDKFCQLKLRNKIPNSKSKNQKVKVGDCIYDFSTNPPLIRGEVHDENNRKTDLGGKFALLSNHFYYFGGNPIPLPDHLLAIVKQGQAHKSTANNPYVESFVDWITRPCHTANKINSLPKDYNEDFGNKCAVIRRKIAEEDELLGENE